MQSTAKAASATPIRHPDLNLAPPDPFADHLPRGRPCHDRRTTLAEQLDPLSDRDRVRDLYLAQAAAALGREIVPDTPTAAELDERFVSDERLYQGGSLRRAGRRSTRMCTSARARSRPLAA